VLADDISEIEREIVLNMLSALDIVSTRDEFV